MLRLDEHRQTDVLGGSTGFLGGARVVRPRHVDARGHGFVQLGALALHALEDVPARERSKHLELAEVLRDQIQLLVVGRKDDDLAERADRRDESRGVGMRIGTDKPLRVPRPEAERTWPVIDRQYADARAAERADRREPVDPAHVDDRSGKFVLGGRTTHRADSADHWQVDLQSSRMRHPRVTRRCDPEGAFYSLLSHRDMSWGLTQRQ